MWRDLSLNPERDTLLCRSSRQLSTQGIDLFAHRTPNGTTHFYLHIWSLKQNEIGILQIIGADAARDFIVECADITDLERNRILEYFPDIF